MIELGHGHDVRTVIELAIAGAGEPVADDIAGRGLDRGSAGVGSKRPSGTKPINTADQDKDLASQQRADPVQLSQGDIAGGHSGGDLRGSRGNALIESADLADQVAGQRMRGPLQRGLGGRRC